VIASRLAAADPSLKILVLEAGPHTHNLPQHYQPAQYLGHLAPNSNTVTHNIAKPSDALAGRPVVVSCGHCVGGASSINRMSLFDVIGAQF
jgi:alcohol oxidase